jgi:hypothetical protein
VRAVPTPREARRRRAAAGACPSRRASVRDPRRRRCRYRRRNQTGVGACRAPDPASHRCRGSNLESGHESY